MRRSLLATSILLGCAWIEGAIGGTVLISEILYDAEGRDDGGTTTRERVGVVAARREAVGVIRRALWPLMDRTLEGSGVPRPQFTQTDTCLPYRSGQDRRAELRWLLGEEPLFFAARSRTPGFERRDRVHVYVDVSGSMAAELPLVYGALVPLLDYIHPQIHLFSSALEDVSAEGLRRGEMETTWGTDIACVTRHMLERKVRRAVILTDGWVGDVPSKHARQLGRRRTRVNSVVTNGGDPSFAEAFTGRVSHLPALS